MKKPVTTRRQHGACPTHFLNMEPERWDHGMTKLAMKPRRELAKRGARGIKRLKEYLNTPESAFKKWRVVIVTQDRELYTQNQPIFVVLRSGLFDSHITVTFKPLQAERPVHAVAMAFFDDQERCVGNAQFDTWLVAGDSLCAIYKADF